jgi:hypothetical protein
MIRQHLKQTTSWLSVRVVKYSIAYALMNMALTGTNPLEGTYLWDSAVIEASRVEDTALIAERETPREILPLSEIQIMDSRAVEDKLDELDKLHIKLAQEG